MSSLSKFGVQVGGSGNILQPKLPYKFRVKLYGFGADGSNTVKLTQNVVSCTRPKFSQEQVEIHSYNSRIRVPSKTDWEPISLVVRDDITNGSVSLIGQQIQKQFNFFEQTSAISGSDVKFRAEIESLDGTHGSALEVWNLEGAWLTEVDYGEGNYETTNTAQQITMTIRFDNATHVSGNNENVVTVGGDPFPAVGGDFANNLGNAIGGFGDTTN
jgi:hypothetical protein